MLIGWAHLVVKAEADVVVVVAIVTATGMRRDGIWLEVVSHIKAEDTACVLLFFSPFCVLEIFAFRRVMLSYAKLTERSSSSSW